MLITVVSQKKKKITEYIPTFFFIFININQNMTDILE